MRRALQVAAIAAISVTLLTACSPSPNAGLSGSFENSDGTVSEWAPADRSAPIEFTGTTESGELVDARDYRDEVLVLNFWYAPCPPCRIEAADLQSLHEQWDGNGAQFLGVNVRDTAARASSFNSEFGITYPSLLDLEESTVTLAVSGAFSPNAVPTTLVLDTEGRIAGRIVGIIDRGVLNTMIRDLVEASQ